MKKFSIILMTVFAMFIMTSCSMLAHEVTNIELVSNEPIVFSQHEEPDINNIMINVTLEGGQKLLRTVRRHWITNLSTEELGDFVMTVTYGEIEMELPYKIVEDATPTLTFEPNMVGCVVAPITVKYGEIPEQPMDPECYGYIFAGWECDGVKYEFNEPLYENKTLTGRWKKMEFTVTFVYDNGERKEYKVFYNNLLPQFPENDFRAEHSFLGWYDGEERFASYMEVKKNMVLRAKFERNLVTVSSYYLDRMSATLQKEFSESKYYDEENYNTVLAIYDEYFNKIKNCTDMEAIKGIFEEYCEKAATVPTYAEKLEEYLTTIDKALYYTEDYQEICEIVADAANAIRNYMGGVPLPKYTYDKAIKAIEKVMTIEEDNAAAEQIKAKYLRVLENIFNDINKENYSEEEWNNIVETYNKGVTDIQNAVGTRAVAKAYTDAVNALKKLVK